MSALKPVCSRNNFFYFPNNRQSTAESLMKVFREYGCKLPDASDGNSNYAPVRNLTYTQAVILLGVQEEGPEQCRK
ncbi:MULTISPECIES: DUF3102 domain-containing protein [Dehalobacter]